MSDYLSLCTLGSANFAILPKCVEQTLSELYESLTQVVSDQRWGNLNGCNVHHYLETKNDAWHSLNLALARVVEKNQTIPIFLYKNPHQSNTILKKFLGHAENAIFSNVSCRFSNSNCSNVFKAI